jgi:hypothetical protein
MGMAGNQTQGLPQLEISMREKSHIKNFNEIFSIPARYFGNK